MGYDAGGKSRIQVTRATHVRNRVCPRVELILKTIIILLIIFLGFIKSKRLQTIKMKKKSLFPARGLNRDRCIMYYVFGPSSCHSATPAERITPF